jgi:hypothetical protein
MLLCAGRSFLQVIEGEKKNVEKLISSIEKDDRHRNITVIIREPIPERSFGEWTMGYADLKKVEIDTIVGINDFFMQDEPFARIDQGRAKKLLNLFKQGQWRDRISNNIHQKGLACRYRLNADFSPAVAEKPPANISYSFAFQPLFAIIEVQGYFSPLMILGLDMPD